MEELPFECDCTARRQPRRPNVLAIRITNPFGRFDWVDGLNAKWGKVSLYRSHGFGALDRGITISAHERVALQDAWVLNTPRRHRRSKLHFEFKISADWTRHCIESDQLICNLESGDRDPCNSGTVECQMPLTAAEVSELKLRHA